MIGAVSDFKFNNTNGFNQCLKFRKQKIKEYKKKEILIGFTEDSQKKIHRDKVKEDSINFKNHLKSSYIGYGCYDYFNSVKANPDKEYITDFRIDYFIFDFNDWLLEQEKKYNN